MKLVTAVILSPVNLPEKKDLYCMGCARYLCSINREILTISMGTAYPLQEVPRNMGWIRQGCHTCKMEFNFYFN